MTLVGTYDAEESSSIFSIPVGSWYTDVLIDLTLTLSDTSAGYLYFDNTIVGNQTSGTFYVENNTKQLWIHNFGGYIDATFRTITYTNQISTSYYSINSLLYHGMPETVGFNPRTSSGLIVSGTAKVYAR